MLGIFLISSIVLKIILFVVIGIIGFLISCKPAKIQQETAKVEEPVKQVEVIEEVIPDQVSEAPGEDLKEIIKQQNIDELLATGKTFYVVRNEAFFYTDEAFESLGPGLYDSLFTDKQKAKEYLLLKQKEVVKDFSLDDLFFYSDSTVLENLHKYFEDNFSINIKLEENAKYFMLDRSIRFPEKASIEQIDEILKLGDIKVARIAEFNSAPKFYSATPNNAFWDMIGVKANKWFYTTEYYGKRVYDSKEAAIEEFNRLSIGRFFNVKIKGSLAALSDSPALLKTLIDNDRTLKYNDVTKEIELTSSPVETKIALLELLKVSPFKLEELSLKEFKKMSEQFQY